MAKEPYNIRDPAAATRQSRLSPHRVSYARQRAIKACHLCRAKRIKCDNRQPTCSSCEKIGAECRRADEEASFIDPGSQLILQRIDDLEGLVKTLLPKKAPNSNTLPAAERNRQLRITTEEVLSWPVFQGQYDSRRDLKKLLRDGSPILALTSPASIDSSFLADETDHDSLQRALDSFFRWIHGKNPMLDESKMKRVVHHMSLEGPAWNADCCLALVVCALGSIASSSDTNFGPSEPRAIATAESYFKAAQRRLGIVVGRGGVLEAQCFFYSGVFLMTKLQPLEAWRLFCQALACCQDFACADPSYQAHQARVDSPDQSLTTEECVYWSCWKSELELRKLLNLPDFAFNDLFYPLLYPTPPISIQGQQTTAWYFYLSEISLRRLEHRIRDEITNALAASESFRILDFHQMTCAAEDLAEEWVQSLPPAMSLQTLQAEDDVLKFILRGHLLDLQEVIYWPWLGMFINDRMYAPEVKSYVVKAFQVAVDRIRTNKPGFNLRHHGTWLLLQACTRSALILLAAAYIPEAAVLLPSGWRDAVLETMELLRFWQRGAGDTGDRLQILEELEAGIK